MKRDRSDHWTTRSGIRLPQGLSMPASPVLVLVDPKAQQRAFVRQRVLSVAVGMVIAGASAVPFLLSLGH
jgi:hypothetical protein